MKDLYKATQTPAYATKIARITLTAFHQEGNRSIAKLARAPACRPLAPSRV